MSLHTEVILASVVVAITLIVCVVEKAVVYEDFVALQRELENLRNSSKAHRIDDIDNQSAWPPGLKTEGQAVVERDVELGPERRLNSRAVHIAAYDQASDKSGCVTVSLASGCVEIDMTERPCNGHRCPTCFIIEDVPPAGVNTLSILGCSSSFDGVDLTLTDALVRYDFVNTDLTNYVIIHDGLARRNVLEPFTSASAFCYSSGAPNLLYFPTPPDAMMRPILPTLLSAPEIQAVIAYGACILGNNGRIYCMPDAHRQVLEIDPTAQAFEIRDTAGDYVPGTCVRALHGNIYCAPTRSTKVLEISFGGTDATFHEYDTSLSTSRTSYSGCIVARNSMIYCAPYDAPSVLVIDPTGTSVTVAELGNTYSGLQKYKACTLSHTGMIYCAPYDAEHVLEIDANSSSDRQLTWLNVSASRAYATCEVMPASGVIYCAPYDASLVLTIHPDKEDSSKVSYPAQEGLSFGMDSALFKSCVAAGDQKIYCAPYGADKVLVMEVLGDLARIYELPTDHRGQLSALLWDVCIRSNYGSVFCAPSGIRHVLEIDPSGSVPRQVLHSVNMINSTTAYSTCALAINGKIFCAPGTAKFVLEIDSGRE
eukprot:TRINITY_DN28248_c0_g1_i1.p1 TRINITY_DN28248_c0_g1~~TRINITY_DN28248_c0_g1_i1.p1  ORF type:complete len:596 (+),score=21.57 TRINITY_DN28248_c0_g1_i1:55-1842(+)